INLSSASGSQPSGNTKKDKIQQTPSSTKKNKIEAHPMSVRSSLINKNCAVKSKDTTYVLHSKLNANYDLQCVTCNGCLFSDNHDSCVLDFVNNVNARVNSKSVKKPLRRNVWKPTRKVFTHIRYTWRPTGRTFAIVGNACPLTRITTPAEVPLRKSIALESNTPKHVVTLVYSRKPKASKNNVSALKTKSWLWHRRLSHLNFGAINHLAKQGLVRGLPKLKFEKDHICSACAMGKGKKKSHKPKSEDTNQEKLYLLHMDLCRPMRDKTVNEKKYILVGISHETYVARSPQQNNVVERRNRTLIEAARTMLIYARAPLFLWAEAVATTCYIQNRSIIRLRHAKTPYELLHDKLLDLIGIFIGYAPTKKVLRIYNRRTRRIIKTIHIDFDELTAMASEQSSSGPALQDMTPATISSGLVPNLTSSTPIDHPAPEVIAPIAEVVAPELATSTGSPSSTTVDQDTPSPSNS
nr:hypothetical protein [Tanacetum cinerariifolium]